MKFYKLECISFVNLDTKNCIAYYVIDSDFYDCEIKKSIILEILKTGEYVLSHSYHNIAVPKFVVHSLLNFNPLNINLKKIYDDYRDITCNDNEFMMKYELFYNDDGEKNASL